VKQKKIKQKNINKLKLKFLSLVFITIFVSVILTYFINNALQLEAAINPQLTIVVTALINTIIIGIVTSILFNKIVNNNFKKISSIVESISKGEYTQIKDVEKLEQWSEIGGFLNEIISDGIKFATGVTKNANALADNAKNLSSIIEGGYKKR